MRNPVALATMLVGGFTLVAVPAPVAAHAVRTPTATSGCREGVQVRPPTETQHSLTTIQFVSTTTGWVAGGSRILATTDGGAHWVVQRRAHNADYSAIDAINGSDAWVVGRQSILRTRNGGRSWRALPDPCPRINSVHFISAKRGYAIAGKSLLRTRDGGRHWRAMAAPRAAQSVCFTDSKRGWLGAHGQVYRTLNGGVTWRRSVRGVRTQRHPTAETYDALVQCAGPSDGWAELIGGAAASQEAHVGYHLSDGGSKPIFSEGYFPYPGVGQLPASPSSYFGAFSALDAHRAFFIDNCPACERGVAQLAVAADDGASLRNFGFVDHINNVTGASFVTRSDGWAIGYALNPPRYRDSWRIIHTADGGRKWHVQRRG